MESCPCDPKVIFDKINEEKAFQVAALGLMAYGAYHLTKNYVAKPAWYLLWKHGLRPSKDLRTRYGGGWAVITGASDGIGAAYAHEFAKRGFNIVLIARNKDKTDAVAAAVKE